jgi:hypothetical protein
MHQWVDTLSTVDDSFRASRSMTIPQWWNASDVFDEAHISAVVKAVDGVTELIDAWQNVLSDDALVSVVLIANARIVFATGASLLQYLLSVWVWVCVCVCGYVCVCENMCVHGCRFFVIPC